MSTHDHDAAASAAPRARERVTAFHQVLILVALSFFGGGGGEASLGERTRDVVRDDVRREAAGAIADELEQALRDHQAGLVQVRDAFFEVARHHGATAEQLDAALSAGLVRAEDFQRSLQDARARLREQVTAEEWQELFGDPD